MSSSVLGGLPRRMRNCESREPLRTSTLKVRRIDLRGEIWRALAGVPLAPRQSVKVVSVDGLTVHVEPAGPREGE